MTIASVADGRAVWHQIEHARIQQV